MGFLNRKEIGTDMIKGSDVNSEECTPGSCLGWGAGDAARRRVKNCGKRLRGQKSLTDKK